jgi:hypothetical protein
MNTDLLVEVIGWLGAGSLLLAYGLLSTGRLPAAWPTNCSTSPVRSHWL